MEGLETIHPMWLPFRQTGLPRLAGAQGRSFGVRHEPRDSLNGSHKDGL